MKTILKYSILVEYKNVNVLSTKDILLDSYDYKIYVHHHFSERSLAFNGIFLTLEKFQFLIRKTNLPILII